MIIWDNVDFELSPDVLVIWPSLCHVAAVGSMCTATISPAHPLKACSVIYLCLFVYINCKLIRVQVLWLYSHQYVEKVNPACNTMLYASPIFRLWATSTQTLPLALRNSSTVLHYVTATTSCLHALHLFLSTASLLFSNYNSNSALPLMQVVPRTQVLVLPAQLLCTKLSALRKA